MKALVTTVLGAALFLFAAQTLQAHEVLDPSIKRSPHDGIVRMYGAGGPDTAFRKVAAAFLAQTGITVEVIAGPEPTWSRQAQANADILWGTSEEEITALLETYTEFHSDDVTPIYIRPAIIAVRAGNPKGIHDFDDLLRDGMRIVVTEGAGVANTSGTGVWEDVAGRLGSLDDIRRFRRNIVAYGQGSGASYKAFVDKKADAWVTWPDWPITHSDVAQIVDLAAGRQIWRDVSVTLSHDADPSAKRFIDFLVSDRGAAIMKTEGWVR
jgi:accessory colonization factor AcfC